MHYIIFYLVFTAFFSVIHGYIFLNIYRWAAGSKGLIFVVLWAICMLPVWFIRSEFKPEYLSKTYFAVAYTWLGFAIILFCSFFALDILRFLAWIWVQTKFFGADFARELASFLKAGRLVPLGIFFALALSIYGIWSAQNPRLYNLTIYSDKISPDSALRLAVVSDIHLNSFTGAKELKKVVTMVNEAKADIFISLGDLVDADMSKRQGEAKLLSEIKTSYGKIAVLGNHEYYVGYEESLAFYKKAGLRLLQAEGMGVQGVYFVGIDDPMARTKGLQSDKAGDLLRNNYDEKRYTLLLSHRPEILDEHLGFFDIQLSGHTHGGQIWPGGPIFRWLSHKSPQHLSRVQDQKGLDKSRAVLEENLSRYYAQQADHNPETSSTIVRPETLPISASPDVAISASPDVAISASLDVAISDSPDLAISDSPDLDSPETSFISAKPDLDRPETSPISASPETLQASASSGQGLNDFDLKEKVAERLKNTRLFITNGFGFWGPPMRVGARPEVLIIDLLPKINQSSDNN